MSYLCKAMMEDKSRISAKAAFTEYLKVKKLRKTPERYAILDKVFEMATHFDIDALYADIEKDGYHVSRATIYNTMELFTDCGLVRRHQFGSQPAQYERVTGLSTHLHLICQQCGKIKEAKDPELIAFMKNRNYSAFHASFFNMYVYGLCSACARRNKRNSKAIR